MNRLWPLLIGLLLLWGGALRAQPDDGFRTPGTRDRTRNEERRYRTGPEELQPTIRRPHDFAKLSPAEAEAMLSELRAAVPERSVESLRAGLEEYRAVHERIRRVEAKHGDAVKVEVIGKVKGLEVRAITLEGKPVNGQPRPRILILGGVHAGTEKTGFESATRFLESAVKDAGLRAKFDITIIPLVSPTALVLGTRENAEGIDINRRFAAGKWTPETRIVGDYVRGKSFHMSLDLHTAGDPGRNGFFLIRGNHDGGLGERMMRAMDGAALMDAVGARPREAAVGPYKLYRIGQAEIESIAATSMDLLERQGTRYIYTFEAPTRADPELQVRGTMRFVRSALYNARKYGKFETRAPRERTRSERSGSEQPREELTRVEQPPRPSEGETTRSELPRETQTERELERLRAEELAALRALEPYRRADGTVDWKRAAGQRALAEVGGLAHFGLALFLKEVATVAATGDRARIEEFFDSLLTTDFYKHYGLFVAGARLGEIGYTRYLQRYVRPRFINGMLKTNLVLGAGIALPMIVDGTFEGKAFAISLGSLGLSSAAVKTGVAGIRWVVDLKRARDTGALARAGLNASRLARVGGWFYTAAELAVVLYLAEEIEERVHAHLDQEAAREALGRAGREFLAAVRAPGATPQALQAAADAYHQAWVDYRNFLYRPLHQDEALLAARLERLAERAKVKADERRAALERLEGHAALRANVESRYGSLEGYAAALLRRDEEALQADVDIAVASYNQNRAAHLDAVYREGRRDEPILAEVKSLGWLLDGGRAGAGADPYGSRGDPFAAWGRSRLRATLEDALEGASSNRLQAYEDERAILATVAAHLRDRKRGGLAAVLDAQRERVSRLQDADQRLIDGDGLIDAGAANGLVEGLQQR